MWMLKHQNMDCYPPTIINITDGEFNGDTLESIQQKALSFDENLYYDILSAFCKSLRGSDSDAALYYMQRLIQGGCDPLLLARRITSLAVAWEIINFWISSSTTIVS